MSDSGSGSTGAAAPIPAARERARVRAGRQGLLFTDDLPRAARGHGLPRADRVLGRRHHLPPARLLGPHRAGRAQHPRAAGSGSQRLYSFRDILVLKVVKRLLDTGVSLQQIRTAVAELRERGIDDLAQITLMSDGARVYECTSPDEIVDLAPGRPGRLRHRRRSGVARGRGLAGRAAGRSGPTSRRPTPPKVRTTGTTSSPRGGGPARPADDTVAAVRRRRGHREVGWRPLTNPRGRDPVDRSRPARGRPAGRRRGNLPGTSQAPRTARPRQLWSTRDRGGPFTGRAPGDGRDPAPLEPRVTAASSTSSPREPGSALDGGLPFERRDIGPSPDAQAGRDQKPAGGDR